VPCIVDEGVELGQLPAELQKLYVATITEQSLFTNEGKARLGKLIEDVLRTARAKREPTGAA
jgi:hypothetical protein